ncbi:hypothetical protein SPRG_00670 [Saprolegnia parasitica CBS 223.65]|uniref:Uncharacterized protein n=1 Tax=Saprolegnia parasitica (strain CBS 223.65) TaxID=695850 RepID=A0A067D6H9_SAPPC|nr:hypothetical protein SPRG_00670 [Saprolegnia parasitica CBS 223.65]KDO34607.1 hypothetical protein SPRG_00670 [Saprolegnia parasitica CBS 223.65]|eukprot:XP_012194284.1 hypothetical protein SPRG_00670 [Saprolegnia parasitica CBS 223.65]
MADGRGSGNAGDAKPKRKVKVVASRYAQSLNLPARRHAAAPPVPASALAAPVSAPASVPHAPAPSTKRTAIAHAQVLKPAPVATSSGSVAERLEAFRQKKAAHEPTRTPTKVVKKARTEATASTMRLDVAAKQPQVPTTSAKDSETVELHESLYYQLCYVERLADQAFQKQEADATAQLAAVFAVVHEKTKALHSMERRWAHERNMFHLHTHLQDHGASLAHLPELLQTYGDQIRDLSRAVAATLHRLPMSDAHCSSSALDAAVQELTRTLEYTLSATLPTWESPIATLATHGASLHTNVAQLDALFGELQARLQQLGAASDKARSQAIGRLEQSTPLHGVVP